jgi:hypothetical protein
VSLDKSKYTQYVGFFKLAIGSGVTDASVVSSVSILICPEVPRAPLRPESAFHTLFLIRTED